MNYSQLYDTHAHLDDEMFDIDRDDVINKIKSSGVCFVNNIASDICSSKASIELAEKYDFIYATVGVHPSETQKMSAEDINVLRMLAKHKKVVAIGEIGLDYHYEDTEREIQKKWFGAQLDLATELGLPVVIHDRESKGECIEILKEKRIANGVIHCFSGSAETAEELLKMGFYISFTGVVTFKNAKRAVRALEVIPLDRLFIETDCPYLTPHPFRGKLNEPANVVYIAQEIAKLKNMEIEDVARMTTFNAKTILGIK